MKKSSNYDWEIDLEDKNSAVVKQLEFIGHDKTVLEFGCSTGYVSKLMRDRACTVTGIEIDGDAAESARKFCERVIVGDIEELGIRKLFSEERFDVALFGDVLEHLKDPKAVLLVAKDLLKKGGFIVLSVPNIAHWSIKLNLLLGKFDYQDMGILDDTHLRFFTRSSITHLLESCGYIVFSIDETRGEVDPATVKTIMKLKGLGKDEIETAFSLINDNDAGVYEYIIKAVPSSQATYLEKISLEKRHLEEKVTELEVKSSYLAEQKDETLRRTEEKDKHIEQLVAQAQEKDKHIEQLVAQAQEKDRQIRELDGEIEDLKGSVREKDVQIGDTERQISEFATLVQEKDTHIVNLETELYDIVGSVNYDRSHSGNYDRSGTEADR